jgi:hypothetical protein
MLKLSFGVLCCSPKLCHSRRESHRCYRLAAAKCTIYGHTACARRSAMQFMLRAHAVCPYLAKGPIEPGVPYSPVIKASPATMPIMTGEILFEDDKVWASSTGLARTAQA